ncbi:hypothetical protein QW060_16940 [Myroides ceti]|uniref:ATP synthase F0 subunit 8 n=1 Tax=Paenimyroides ceti TaxID=395087 RepID=A0ABT8CMZ2_9FLAO|nr:hypothetical protein [Paenimyroides ceti]MDN3705521.1 hypothetical protein [Paenimyroides ceti]MDN3708791.1 hypothetical protein [Paenimyroides ceti]
MLVYECFSYLSFQYCRYSSAAISLVKRFGSSLEEFKNKTVLPLTK